MEGCTSTIVRGLLGWVLLCGILVVVLHFGFGFRPGLILVPAAAIGSMFWIGFNLFRAAWRSFRERRIVGSGLAAEAPVDGKSAVLVGTLEPFGEILTAPLDGSPCVAYSYEIGQQIGSGRSGRRMVHYRGVGIAPSVLRTARGNYSLLAVPNFEGEGQALFKGETLAIAERYVAGTPFRAAKTSADELVERWNDADGEYRSDVSFVGDTTPNLSLCWFNQYRVKPGEPVCLIGLFSAARNGIVPGSTFSAPTRLIVGDPLRAAATLAGQVKVRTFLGLCFSATGAFLLYKLISVV